LTLSSTQRGKKNWLDRGSMLFHKAKEIEPHNIYGMFMPKSPAAPQKAKSEIRDPGLSSQHEIRVGGKLKHARLLKGMTLKQVSDSAGCSESLLSKIENGRAYPSLPMLYRIVVSLGTNIASLLASGGDPSAVVFYPQDRLAAAIETDGIRLERLFPHKDGNLLESTIHLIDPGAQNEGVIVHQGEELGYVLEGEIELVVDGKTYRAPSGSSFHFRSESPHGYRNATDRPAKVLWVSTPPTF
jgi:transcriptional regulator with XRE-family HTH domain